MKVTSIVAGALLAVSATALSVPAANAGLAYGEHFQYPSTGGTWRYGFWNGKVRSYYTVGQCHGSTAEYNGDRVRSVDTIAGRESVAEKSALNYPGADDAYYYRVC